MQRYRRAVLLYNPFAGTSHGREERVHRAAETLQNLASEVVLEPTRGPGTGGEQAKCAIANGCDLIIACGGDGTIFDVLQGVAESEAAMAVLPLGTGNVLAADLDLPPDAEQAARELLGYEPRRIALGRIRYNDNQARYFTVAAGVGVHAELIYKSTAQAKQSGGIAAYYLSGFDLLFRHEFVKFRAEVTLPTGEVREDDVQEIVAMRVRSFGRWLKRWRPGSSLLSDHMQLVLLRESSRAAMVRYVIGAITGTAYRKDMTSRSADVEFVPAIRVKCTPLGEDSARRVRTQADGEILGAMPAELELIPKALTLLMPQSGSK